MDTYDTPEGAIAPLLPFLKANCVFAEPCAGKGNISDYLESKGYTCGFKGDLEPRREDVDKMDALKNWLVGYDYIITNPPWTRQILHPMIMHFKDLAPTWLLFDADWMHTRQASKYMLYCSVIISVGRVKWIEGSKHTGKDNCCWYLFKSDIQEQTVFMERQ